MNDLQRRPIDTGALFWGFALIGFGILFMLRQLRITDVNIFQLWPLLVINAGFSKLLQRGTDGGLSLIAIGVWLQLIQLHLFGLTYRSSWPLMLIAVGAGVIVKAVLDAARTRRAAAEENHES